MKFKRINKTGLWLIEHNYEIPMYPNIMVTETITSDDVQYEAFNVVSGKLDDDEADKFIYFCIELVRFVEEKMEEF